jgi:hypothetical protein
MRDIRALITQDVVTIDCEQLSDLLEARALVAEGYHIELSSGVMASEGFTLRETLYMDDAILFPGEYSYEMLRFIIACRFDTPVSVSCGDLFAPDTCVLVTPSNVHPPDGWDPFDIRGKYKIYLRR